MIEDDYCPEYEPTDSERLKIYVEDDAEDPESNSLMYRQQERWEQLQEDVQNGMDREMDRFSKAKKVKTYPGPTWWKIWQPPSLSRTVRANALLDQGDLSINSEIECDDLYIHRGSPRRLISSHRIWMDFVPNDRWGFPDLSFLGETITQDDLHGLWGHWDYQKSRFRSRIFGAISWRDEKKPELGITECAVKMLEPPPYGLWLPTLVPEELDSSF